MNISHAAEAAYTQGSFTFCPFLSVPGTPQIYVRYSPITKHIMFFARSRKKFKKHDLHIYMAQKWFTFSRPSFILFFRKSAKQWGELDFCGVENASKIDKNYAFWRAPRFIRRRRSGFRTGIQNRAKLHQNASKITAKWPRKIVNIDIAMIKNACPRLTCENASKRINCLRSRCCFAHAMDERIDQNRRKFTTKLSQKIRSSVLQW